MNKLGLIAAAIGGIATAGIAKFYAAARAYETERAAGKFDDDVTETNEGNAEQKTLEIVWVSADKGEPLFGMNEKVTVENPYDLSTWADARGTPMQFRITDMEYDKEDAVWRYELDNSDVYYSEEWLETALYAEITKEGSDMPTKKTTVEAEANRKLQIDYYLADLHEAMAAKDEKRQAEALAELKRLNAEGASK